MNDPEVSEREAIARFLSGLWTKVIGKQVGPDEDFFDAGGSSLSGIKMILEVQSVYKVELDIEAFFEEPTIAHLAGAVMQRRLVDVVDHG